MHRKVKLLDREGKIFDTVELGAGQNPDVIVLGVDPARGFKRTKNEYEYRESVDVFVAPMPPVGSWTGR